MRPSPARTIPAAHPVDLRQALSATLARAAGSDESEPDREQSSSGRRHGPCRHRDGEPARRGGDPRRRSQLGRDRPGLGMSRQAAHQRSAAPWSRRTRPAYASWVRSPRLRDGGPAARRSARLAWWASAIPAHPRALPSQGVAPPEPRVATEPEPAGGGRVAGHRHLVPVGLPQAGHRHAAPAGGLTPRRTRNRDTAETGSQHAGNRMAYDRPVADLFEDYRLGTSWDEMLGAPTRPVAPTAPSTTPCARWSPRRCASARSPSPAPTSTRASPSTSRARSGRSRSTSCRGSSRRDEWAGRRAGVEQRVTRAGGVPRRRLRRAGEIRAPHEGVIPWR